MDDARPRYAIEDDVLVASDLLPDGAAGMDAGMTLTKVALAADGVIRLSAHETHHAPRTPLVPPAATTVGVTGALAPAIAGTPVQEIDAAARGAAALLVAAGAPGDGFILALLGTGTAFAAVRDGRVTHLGGTPLGGGSFAGIARRVAPGVAYDELVAAAHRGNRTKVDAMISDIYPEGVGRVGPNLTAAHLARDDGGGIDDFLAGLLNLHGENIAQIAASRGIIAGVRRIVLAGGFAHNNGALVASITSMCGLFGVAVETVKAPGYAGAVGAAMIAAGVPE